MLIKEGFKNRVLREWGGSTQRYKERKMYRIEKKVMWLRGPMEDLHFHTVAQIIEDQGKRKRSKSFVMKRRKAPTMEWESDCVWASLWSFRKTQSNTCSSEREKKLWNKNVYPYKLLLKCEQGLEVCYLHISTCKNT